MFALLKLLCYCVRKLQYIKKIIVKNGEKKSRVVLKKLMPRWNWTRTIYTIPSLISIKHYYAITNFWVLNTIIANLNIEIISLEPLELNNERESFVSRKKRIDEICVIFPVISEIRVKKWRDCVISNYESNLQLCREHETSFSYYSWI